MNPMDIRFLFEPLHASEAFVNQDIVQTDLTLASIGQGHLLRMRLCSRCIAAQDELDTLDAFVALGGNGVSPMMWLPSGSDMRGSEELV